MRHRSLSHSALVAWLSLSAGARERAAGGGNAVKSLVALLISTVFIKGGIHVSTVATRYSGADTRFWTYKPDFEIETPTDLINILNNYR